MNPTARKLTALSLAAVMGLGLAACSGGSGNGDATGTASPTPGTTACLLYTSDAADEL